MTTELLFNKIVIIGAGTMGRGIAQVCAMAGYTTILNDISEETLTAAHKQIVRNLSKGVEKGKVSMEVQERALFQVVSFSRFNRVDRRCRYGD